MCGVAILVMSTLTAACDLHSDQLALQAHMGGALFSVLSFPHLVMHRDVADETRSVR